MYRVIRASSLSFAQRDFVVAAKTMGATDTPDRAPRDPAQRHPGHGHLQPHHRGRAHRHRGHARLPRPVGGLPTPSWGNLINEGTSNGALSTDPWIMLWPALAMFLLLWSINLIGDRLRQRFDIREGLL